MLFYLNELETKAQYKLLPFQTKFYDFWMKKKWRFFYVFMLYITYHYGQRLKNWII